MPHRGDGRGKINLHKSIKMNVQIKSIKSIAKDVKTWYYSSIKTNER
jgi:hypothetical protein